MDQIGRHRLVVVPMWCRRLPVVQVVKANCHWHPKLHQHPYRTNNNQWVVMVKCQLRQLLSNITEPTPSDFSNINWWYDNNNNIKIVIFTIDNEKKNLKKLQKKGDLFSFSFFTHRPLFSHFSLLLDLTETHFGAFANHSGRVIFWIVEKPKKSPNSTISIFMG